jgi:hypothetical protein
MDRLQTRIVQIKENHFLPIFITGAAGILYAIQAWYFSRIQRSLLDEGNYLLKGYLFVTKQYTPYQDFGPWTNKMPLSFLIPGWIQQLFSPGLLTGRNYAFILSLLILIFSVIIGLRLGGKWGGALTAIIFACSPAPLKIYTKVLTEGLTATMLLISLIFILGENRPTWQLILGSFVAGLIPVTRINLLPVLPVILLYLWILYGWRKGILFALVSLVPFIGFHAFYWPGILRLWAKWIPAGMVKGLDLLKHGYGEAEQAHQTAWGFRNRLLAFSQGIRFQLPFMLAAFTALSFWPKKWSDSSKKRSAIFLLVLFGSLFALHLWAAIFLDYNIHAFFRYLAAFNFLGIFLILTTWDNWNLDLPKWRQVLIGFGLVFFTLIIGFSISEQSSTFGIWFKGLLENNFYIFNNHELFGKAWDGWKNIQASLGWDYALTLRMLALGVSLLAILLIVLLAKWVYKRVSRSQERTSARFQLSHALIGIFAIGILLSPTKLLGRGFVFYDCSPTALKQYQTAVNMTAPLINHSDRVFYIGKDTQVVLLGLIEKKDIRIFPQQLNAYNSFYFGGDSEQLTQAGLWNDAIAQEWINESQVLLFEQQAISTWFEETASNLDLSDFELVGETNNTCTYDQRIYIFRRE